MMRPARGLSNYIGEGVIIDGTSLWLDIGKAQMADTGTMTLTVERYGQEGTFEVEQKQE